MLSKEEIEKRVLYAKSKFWEIKHREPREGIEILLEIIEQLETDKQKLIEKLEEDNIRDTESVKRYEEMRRNCTDEFYLKSYQTTIHKLNTKREARSGILSIIKGED